MGNNKLHFITFNFQSYDSKCIMKEHDNEQMYK